MSAAHAVLPPVHAPAPPVQRKAEPLRDLDDKPQRLLTSLSAIPAVQRRCTACAAGDDEQQMPVMPKLEVGPVDDPFEREADDIAGQVMAMRQPTVQRMEDDSEDEIRPRRAAIQRQLKDVADEIDDSVMPRRAAVQRKCAACASEDEMPVQPRRAPASVQRTSAALLEKDPLRDLVDMPRMKPEEAAAGTEHISASATQLTSGGSPLSGTSREFFEGRMGHDLSGIRVHRGNEAQALNESISSRAFTFQNHVWLGKSEAEGPSFTMAHELTHAIQQTQPERAQARKRGSGTPRPIVRRAPELKFAGKAYWTSEKLEKAKKNSGSQIHEDLLEQFQKTHTNLLIEAPIPKARASARGRSRSGEADLYIGTDNAGAERTIGINFRKKGDPAKLTSTTKQPHHSPPYSHKRSARPWLRGRSTIMGADEAPTSISLGELKPDKVKKGATQLTRYENAIKRTQSHTNAFLKDQYKDSDETPPQWQEPSLTRIDLAPPSLSGVTGKSFGRHKLVVYQFAGYKLEDAFAIGRLVHEPPTDVYGELKIKKHTEGIYYYWWEPDADSKAKSLPPDLARQKNLSDELFKALKTNRKVVLPLRKHRSRTGSGNLAPASGRRRARRSTVRSAAYAPIARPSGMPPAVMRRKSGNAKKFRNHFDDNFRTTKWLPNRKKVADAYGGAAKTYKGAKGPAVLTDWYLMQIDKDLASGDRQNIETKFKSRGRPAQRVKQLRQMHVLAQPFAPTMAKLRVLFGGVFAKGSELYEKIKAKFEKRSKPTKSLSGGGILGALLRASFKVLLLIGRQIVASTMIQLTEQLKACMTKMFERYFSVDDEIEAVRQRIEGVKGDLEADVATFVGGDPEQLAETLFGPYGQHVDTVRSYIEGITKAAGPVLTAYKVVKWGIQALACASPPLIGCLWGLARSAIEWAAGKVIETCWFMRKITPKILKIEKIRDFMRGTSKSLSNGILTAAGSLLPDPVGTFLASCKTEAPAVAMPSSKSICQEGGGSGGMGNDPKPSEEALAFWDRWEKLPFDKQMALKKMLGRKAAEGKAKADWDKMNAMLAWAEKTDLTEMKRLATEAKKGNSSMIPGPVAKVKQAAESGKAEAEKKSGNAADKDAPTTSPGDTEAPPSGAGDKGDAGGITAKRSGEKPVSGKKASDLHPYAFIPSDLSAATPAKGDKLTGDIYVSWTPKGGKQQVIVMPSIKMVFDHLVGETKEVGGFKYVKWFFKPVKSETFRVAGRKKAFVLVADRLFGLFVPRPKSK